MEEESPDISPTHSFMSYALPDDMIRPLSASESAVLSKYTSPPLSPGLPQSSYSFGALPPLKESPSSPVSPRSPKTPVRTLKQKVSRLFSSSEKRSSPRHDIDVNEKFDYHHEKNVPQSPLSNHWKEAEDSVKILRHTEPAVDTNSSDYQRHNSSHHDSEDLTSRRRPTWGPHSSNRHQTLQDALRQLETDNNSLTFEDIMCYIDAGQHEDRAGHGGAAIDEKVERPWQPDTWNEPTLVRMPHNRPSDSNLSTNAPSTRASIRPYVERAAAFMAGGGDGFSSSSSSLDTTEERHEASSVNMIDGNDHIESADEEDNRTEDEYEVSLLYRDGQGRSFLPRAPSISNMSQPTPLLLRRSISRRARPLSSNPPDLDAPLFFDSSSSTSSSALVPGSRAITPPPRRTATPQPLTRISWSPEIPARHPDHRIVRFEDDATTAIKPRAGTPPPLNTTTAPQAAAPRVVTTAITPRKKAKKHCKCCGH